MERTAFRTAILTMPGGDFVAHHLVKHLDICGIVVDVGKWGNAKTAPPPRSTIEKLQYYWMRGGVRGASKAMLNKLLRRENDDRFGEAKRAETAYMARLDERLVGYPFLTGRVELRQFASFDEIGAYHRIPVVEVDNINDETSTQALRGWAPDLAIVCGGRIIKKHIIEIPKHGMLNKHSSILPRHRGLSSEYWCLYYEDFDHLGVTVHFVAPGLDSGNILVQKRLTFMKGDTPASLRFKSEILGREALVEAARLIAQTGTKGTPQDETKATRNKPTTLETDRELFRKLPRLWDEYGATP
jgi:folate-dependent phosphoribosylglycinamide formyltransferase PurN